MLRAEDNKFQTETGARTRRGDVACFVARSRIAPAE